MVQHSPQWVNQIRLMAEFIMFESRYYYFTHRTHGAVCVRSIWPDGHSGNQRSWRWLTSQIANEEDCTKRYSTENHWFAWIPLYHLAAPKTQKNKKIFRELIDCSSIPILNHKNSIQANQTCCLNEFRFRMIPLIPFICSWVILAGLSWEVFRAVIFIIICFISTTVASTSWEDDSPILRVRDASELSLRVRGILAGQTCENGHEKSPPNDEKQMRFDTFTNAFREWRPKRPCSIPDIIGLSIAFTWVTVRS